MKPEDVTDEMLDAAQAVADQASLFGDPWEAKRAVLAAAINAMPPAARGVAGTLRTLYGGCPFCGCPDCVAGECRRVGSMPKPDFAPPGYTDKLVERIATIDPLPAQDMSSDPPLMPQTDAQAQIDALKAERDRWIALYRRAVNEANGLTNYVEDRPELRRAEKALTVIEAEARAVLGRES